MQDECTCPKQYCTICSGRLHMHDCKAHKLADKGCCVERHKELLAKKYHDGSKDGCD